MHIQKTMRPPFPILLLLATLLCALFLVPSSFVLAQVEPECDLDGDDVVDAFNADSWDETQQQMNFANFYGATFALSPLHSPKPADAFSIVGAAELSYIPQLSCLERAVYYGTKTEHTNKSPVLPRLRLSLTFKSGVSSGIAVIPGVSLFGVTTVHVAGEVGYGRILHHLSDQLEVGARAHLSTSAVVGDLAGPVGDDPAVNDVYLGLVPGADLAAGYRLRVQKSLLVPYVSAGLLVVNGQTLVGEDGITIPGELEDYLSRRYRGPSFLVGAEWRAKALRADLEIYMVPLPDFRFFVSPRLLLGVAF